MSSSHDRRSDLEPIGIGTIHLDVLDIERSVSWWHDLVGLRVLGEGREAVALGVDGDPLIVLRPGATEAARRGYTGLYHMAINLPDEHALAQVLARVLAAEAPFSGVDHIVAKSLYVTDPNGIGLELALETPQRVRSVNWPETERAPEIIDVEGRRRESLGELDLNPLLAVVSEVDLSEPVASGATVGHVHLAVAELEPAFRFYRDVLGFARINYVPVIGYGDLGNTGTLLHKVALNTWQTAGATPRPAGMAGMTRFTVLYGSQEPLSHAIMRLDEARDEASADLTHDPAGNVIALSASAALAA
ncbi:MAG: VOC family protein [Solirubrobacteraceae bacterium]